MIVEGVRVATNKQQRPSTSAPRPTMIGHPEIIKDNDLRARGVITPAAIVIALNLKIYFTLKLKLKI